MASMCIMHYDQYFLQSCRRAKGPNGATNGTLIKRDWARQTHIKTQFYKQAYVCYSQNAGSFLRIKGHSQNLQGRILSFFLVSVNSKYHNKGDLDISLNKRFTLCISFLITLVNVVNGPIIQFSSKYFLVPQFLLLRFLTCFDTNNQ